jgi:predicted nucleotidyltransferase
MVSNLVISGSFAKGNLKQSSDIDVLVEFEDGHKILENFIGLKHMKTW